METVIEIIKIICFLFTGAAIAFVVLTVWMWWHSQ